jgi:uncharacterized protein (TIGR03000 family)
MIRRTLLFGAPLLAVAVLLLTPAASQAQRRGWGGGYYGGYRGGWNGYYGGWDGYRGYYGGSGYYPNYYGWSGYSYPSYSYYSYPSNSYYGSGYYPSSGYYSSGYYPTNASMPYYSTYLIDNNQPRASGYQSFYPSDSSSNQNVAFVRLAVPPDAEVWFDGQQNQKTQQGGSDRLYVTPPLEPNKDYYYEVRAKFMENGQPVDRTKRVNVHAGDRADVSFMGGDNSTTTEPRTETPTKAPAAETPTKPPAEKPTRPKSTETKEPTETPAAPPKNP